MGTKKAPTVADVKETRIALAFFGGVALAVYESGVALEFFRLVKGEGVYSELRNRNTSGIGDVAVDIITGTSAGGLNGAFLANAIVNRGDMRKLLTLWREEGDIDKLLYGPFESGPESLLDGNRFRQKIFEALIVKRTAPPSEASLQATLDLFLTATNLDGDRVVITTPDNEEISTRTHRQVFHFRYRKKESRSEELETNDFKTEEDLCLLAQAARASASFPLAFAPVLVEKSGLGQRALNLEADAYHIDGGVLDNKPIDLALRAIAGRRADKQTNRLLFYVEPDPERVESRACQSAPRLYNAPEVVLKALVGLPGYQSLTTALQDIEQRNRDVAELKRTLGYYEKVAAKYREGKLDQSTATGNVKYHKVSDAPTALFRAQEDGYLDLRLQRGFPQEFFKSLMELVEKANDIVATLSADDEEAAFQVKKTIYRIKTHILQALDLKYHRRLYRYLVQIVRQLYPGPPSGTGGGEEDDWKYILEATERLNSLKKLLYDQDELIAEQERSQADALEAELADIRAQLREILEKLGAVRTSERATELLGGFAKKLEETEFLQRRIEFLNRVRSTVLQRLGNVHDELQEKWKDRKSELQERRPFRLRLKEGYWALRDAIESFHLRDIIIYPAMSGNELTAELEQIHFARVSPTDADRYIPGLSAADKLAGEQFAHFGGFLNEEWRGNDLTWGRLDAAEIILRKLLPGDPQLEYLIKKAHGEIIEEMSSLGMGIYAQGKSAAAPAQPGLEKRDDLIGKQDLSVIPTDKKVNWSWRGAITLTKITRQTLARTKGAFLFQRLLGSLDWAIRLMTGVFVLFTWVFVKLFRRDVLRRVMLAAALIALGILLHYAWDHPLRGSWYALWRWMSSIF